MKTPREILLARHHAAESSLNAVRQTVIKDLSNKDAKAQSSLASLVSWLPHCVLTPWRELILPSRRIWTGLAAVWVLLFAINFSQRSPVSRLAAQSARSPAVMMSWQAQQRLMNELLTDRMVPTEADRPRDVTPRPRTETISIIAI